MIDGPAAAWLIIVFTIVGFTMGWIGGKYFPGDDDDPAI